MINGLGLFAALTPPDAAPQPAPADDPALFAAALVAALGLHHPVQVSLPAPQPVADAEAATDEGEQPPEGDQTQGNVASDPSADEPLAQPIVARVTADPEVESESATLGAVRQSKAGREGTKGSGKEGPATGTLVDQVSDEPARPDTKQQLRPVDASTPAGTATPICIMPRPMTDGAEQVAQTTTGESVANDDQAAATPSQPIAGNAPVASAVDPKRSKAERKSGAVGSETAGRLPHPRAAEERHPARSTASAKRTEESAAASVASLSGVAGLVPPSLVPVAAVSQQTAQPGPAGESDTAIGADTRSATAPTAKAVAPRVDGQTQAPYKAVPPQSVDERTARAIAENTRVARQLAELLGDADVTEFKVQLGSRRGDAAPPLSTSVPTDSNAQSDARVTWVRTPATMTGETISGQMLPQATIRARQERGVPGTIGHESIDPVIDHAVSGEAVSFTTVTSRPEIVRMVANASRAMAPNLTAPEGAAVSGKAPAPSVMPSLPVARQEVPASVASTAANESEERDRKLAGDSSASDAASSTSLSAANNQPVATRHAAPGEVRESREARNLPPDGSTDQKQAGSPDRVTLQVADDEGRQTRIRVSVTGNQIRAVITPPDSASARQLEQRMDQLHDTLVRQGFADPKLIVRAAPEAAQEAAASAAGSQEGRSTVPAGKDQPAGDQRQGRGQREQDRGAGHRHPQGHPRDRDPRDRRR